MGTWQAAQTGTAADTHPAVSMYAHMEGLVVRFRRVLCRQLHNHTHTLHAVPENVANKL